MQRDEFFLYKNISYTMLCDDLRVTILIDSRCSLNAVIKLVVRSNDSQFNSKSWIRDFSKVFLSRFLLISF